MRAISELRIRTGDVGIERAADPDIGPGELVAVAHHDRVGLRIRLEHVERLRRGDTDSLPLAGRERPVAAVLPECGAGGVDDRTGARGDALAREEAAVVA